MAASLFDQNPWGLFSLIVATCLLYQRLRLLIFLPSTIKLVPILSTQVNQLFKPWSMPKILLSKERNAQLCCYFSGAFTLSLHFW